MVEKIALITGTSRGLGRSMALHLARKGVHVIGTYLKHRQGADELAAEIEKAGSHASMLQLDVSDNTGFADFADRVEKTLKTDFGRRDFDFLVNNAGIGISAPFAETTGDQFDKLIRIHVKAPFFLAQTLLPRIAEGGRIINVSSGLARFTFPGYSAYAIAKGAVEVMTRYMALELGERKIRVNVIAPGAIETDFDGGAVRDNKEINRFISGTIPLGRVGLPDDIGAAVAAILSDEFGWVNGARIEISGGQNI